MPFNFIIKYKPKKSNLVNILLKRFNYKTFILINKELFLNLKKRLIIKSIVIK